ncbi:laminin subunit alpha-1-like [Cynocephalus volans]|uniref:laminin subunit alpha-1-like n=1 Tax=Cynocephalus volans TaxID=110931 RepID=UPI002FC95B07
MHVRFLDIFCVFLFQVFQVAYVIIKAANAPRPGNWILEHSLNGTTFSPWQYYAVSDTECLTRYNITPRRGPPTYRAGDEVICTSYYSRLVPLEHGEIHTSLINSRPSADDLSPKLLEFTAARYIRLRFQGIRTLNADLMTLSHWEPKDIDPIVTRRYYYSIKDISVGGMCICYGHASSCPWDDTTKKRQCQCEHNTCGERCDRCFPGYHQQPWRPMTVSSGNTCEECNCHNKAKDCYYDESVADQKRSVNTAGQFRGVGVCINCLQNTMGINCETCVDGHYRPHQENVEGKDCHRYKPGFYNLKERNPQGCSECFCFGVSDVCDGLSWPISQFLSNLFCESSSPFPWQTSDFPPEFPTHLGLPEVLVTCLQVSGGRLTARHMAGPQRMFHPGTAELIPHFHIRTGYCSCSDQSENTFGGIYLNNYSSPLSLP